MSLPMNISTVDVGINTIGGSSADPSAGAGIPAQIGSLHLQGGGSGRLWTMNGFADTDWIELAVLARAQVYTAAQTVAPRDLTNIAGATAINAAQSNTFKGVATAAAVISNPTNLEDGQTVVFRLQQGGAGLFAITFGANFDFGDDGAPDTSADATGTMLVVTGVSDGTKLFCGWKKGFTP